VKSSHGLLLAGNYSEDGVVTTDRGRFMSKHMYGAHFRNVVTARQRGSLSSEHTICVPFRIIYSHADIHLRNSFYVITVREACIWSQGFLS
jgi:hypothetical protein